MLKKCLIASVSPVAHEENCVIWKNYRITVLADRLFRLEYNENKCFRNCATQSVWYRNMPIQKFSVNKNDNRLIIETSMCSIYITDNRKESYVILDGKKHFLTNLGNLGGTYRTLDMCDGDMIHSKMYSDDYDYTEKLNLNCGVCSKTGVAVLDDTSSLAISNSGEIYNDNYIGSDEYIFAYGDDYRNAVKALYMITGYPPLIPKYSLGNWWSRYHSYTDKEYIDLLDKFKEKGVPITVATIDMDWHYSRDMENDFHITELGRNTPFYGGANGWTGYTWNKNLFPDYKSFLKEVKKRNLKITLNLHPADGVRWWEDMYDKMAKAMDIDGSTLQHIPFDMTDSKFINAYFDILHKPYENEGVDFWWIDWQQGSTSKIEGLDPLWTLNHYHYLDNSQNHSIPLILSRYCGIGSHRYPIGFSGDTIVTWNTLKYLPYFTATASNIGYTWWSHDIGGHMLGYQDNQLFLRSIQFGVFSPINRLHSGRALTTTKEPWVYGNGCGELAIKFLKLRHQLIPYLYTQAYLTNKIGKPLIEPLYYRHKNKQAYNYKNEYYFGDLLVSPITTKINSDGFAKVKTWLPEGIWTDIFTNMIYTVGKGGKELYLYRRLESIPVLAKAGSILPLSLDEGNLVTNPQNLSISIFNGNGNFELYEDDNMSKNDTVTTVFCTELLHEQEGKSIQKLTICSQGCFDVIPQNRVLTILFKNISDGKISVFKDNEEIKCERVCDECVGVKFNYMAGASYTVRVNFIEQTQISILLKNVKSIITTLEDNNSNKVIFLDKALKVSNIDDYVKVVDESNLKSANKAVLKEFI